MTLNEAIDAYIADMRIQGRINSLPSERAYRGTLEKHAQDAGNRDPRYTARDDVKRTLARWKHPNTQRKNRAVLVSFYDWTMQELNPGRKDNPARQTRPPKKRKPNVYRLTRTEAIALLDASKADRRERWTIHLGICAGLRLKELLGLQGRHLQRTGFVWISSDIGKGGRERWIPIIPDLAPIADEIRSMLAVDDHVLPKQRWRNPPVNSLRIEYAKHPASPQAIYHLVGRVGRRAGIQAPIHPHLLRHAFADHITRRVGIEQAQAMLGHADLKTTQGYIGEPTLDELARLAQHLTYRTPVLGGPETPRIAREATTGIEPVVATRRPVTGDPDPLRPGGPR